jgi:hypothetical protein
MWLIPMIGMSAANQAWEKTFFALYRRFYPWHPASSVDVSNRRRRVPARAHPSISIRDFL